MLPTGAQAAVVTPHAVTPDVVSPHVVGPPASSPAPAPSPPPAPSPAPTEPAADGSPAAVSPPPASAASPTGIPAPNRVRPRPVRSGGCQRNIFGGCAATTAEAEERAEFDAYLAYVDGIMARALAAVAERERLADPSKADGQQLPDSGVVYPYVPEDDPSSSSGSGSDPSSDSGAVPDSDVGPTFPSDGSDSETGGGGALPDLQDQGLFAD